MSDSPRRSRQLSRSPNLEQKKKQARELLEAARAGNPEALERFRKLHPRFATGNAAPLDPASLALHDAQLVLAREYGFPSWPRFKAYLKQPSTNRHTRPIMREVAWYEDRAQGLLSMHTGGLPNALAQIREWHPRFRETPDEELTGASFSIDDARLVYAREHGFEGWDGFIAHVKELSRNPGLEPFLEAFEAMKARNGERFRELLRSHPEIARLRGTNGNTLLNLGCSLLCGGPVARTVPESEIRAAFALLLGFGADVNEANDRGWTPLHQAAYANQPLISTILLEAHASLDAEAHGAGGTPLAVALFWGHHEVVELLAASAVSPRNLRVAAGLGRMDLIQACFTRDGQLTPEAGAKRDFYRPHSGFPVWHPANHRQEILDEALVWAAKSDRTEVFRFLIEQGANLAADPYRGTPLLWAVSARRQKAVNWLLDHGADVNQRATFGGPGHGEGVTALHLAAGNNDLDMVKLLIQRGADATATDALYKSRPAGWAEHGRFDEVRRYLESVN